MYDPRSIPSQLLFFPEEQELNTPRGRSGKDKTEHKINLREREGGSRELQI